MTIDSKRGVILSDKSTPWLLNFRSSQNLTLVTVCAAAFTDGFIYAAFVPILPLSLEDRYGLDSKDTQFWTSALLAIFGAVVLAGSPIIGWVCDGQKSRKSAYMFGLICLSGGVATLAITRYIWMLVISRILQGISAAVVFTVGLALIADTVDSRDIGYYMGYVLSSLSCGGLVGPVFGSLAFNAAGYMAVVGMMGVLAFIDIILRMLMIERSEAEKYYTSVEEVSERTALLQSVSDSSDGDLTPPPSNRWQTFTLLANPEIATAIYGVYVHVILIAAFDGVLPIFVSQVFNWSSLRVALCFLAIAIPDTCLGPVAGKMCDVYGPRWLACSGFLLTAVPMVGLQFVDHTSEEMVWLLFGLLTLIGFALPLIISPLAADLFHIIESFPANSADGAIPYAQAYGLFTCAMAGGTLVGPILAGWVKERWGWTAMCWVMGACVASGAVPVYFFTGRSRGVGAVLENEAVLEREV